MLESKVQKSSQNDVNNRSKYMTLTFLGFYDPKGKYTMNVNGI
jgi:hypothetical protein